MIPVIVIGAGLAGLTVAKALKAPILEKSKGLGGRLATRRIGDDRFDHGISFWPTATQALTLHQGSFIPQGMTALAKKMAKDLTIHLETRALKLIQTPDGWLIETNKGQMSAHQVVLTAPVPQALELLSDSQIATHPQWEIPYHKALIGLYNVAALPDDRSFMFQDHRFTFQRDKALAPEGLVIESSPLFAEQFFDSSDDIILEQLNHVLREALGTRQISHQEIKKWRYSRPKKAHHLPYLEAAPGLYLCGDGFLSPDVDGALLSAQTLVRERF